MMDREINAIVAKYDVAVRQLIRIIERARLGDLTAKERRQLEHSLLAVLDKLDADTKRWVDEYLPQAYATGQAAALLALGSTQSLREALDRVSHAKPARLHTSYVQAMLDDTFDDLLQATTNTRRRVKTVVRQVFAEQMQAKAAQGLGRRTMTRDAVQLLERKLADAATFAIRDRANRVWALDTYADVVVRSKIQQAHIAGTRNQAIADGVYYGVISRHGATDACAPYEGKIVKLVANAPGSYPTIEQLKATGDIFHPNCRHVVTPIRLTDAVKS